MSRSLVATLPALADLDAAHEHVESTALRASGVGQVGLELEYHLVDRADPGRRPEWHEVTGLVAGVPPLSGGSAVTLEPGGQVELSGPPAPLGQAVSGLLADEEALRGSTDRYAFAGTGTDPLRTTRRINPGDRYRAMEAHWQAVGCGPAGLAMMTSTAALQVNLDAGPASGWAARVGLAHRLGPVLIAVSASSPMLAGQATGWHSTRQRIWNELDQARCGPLLGGADPAAGWAEYALCAPVMLVDAEPVTRRVSFADWVTGRAELAGRRPTVPDLDYHLTTLFPPVRLRGFLEIRYLDAAPTSWWPAIAAVLTTLLDDPVAADVAAEAAEPVAGRWVEAARDGLSDNALHRAAVTCLSAAVDRVEPALRPGVEALAELSSARRSPGDLLPPDPSAAFLAAADLAVEEHR